MNTSALTGDQFIAALARARKGDRIAYHVGLLMRDRFFNVEVESVAQASWRAHMDGKVLLMQQRVTPTACRYLAVVR